MMKEKFLLVFISIVLNRTTYAASNPNILALPPAAACGFSGYGWPQSLVNTHGSRVTFIPIVPDVTPSTDLILDLDVDAAIIRIPYSLLTVEENNSLVRFFMENNLLSNNSFSEPTTVRGSNGNIIYRLNDNTHDSIVNNEQNNRFSLYRDETNNLLEILLIRNEEDVINEDEQAIEILINNYLSREDRHVANYLNTLGFLNGRHGIKTASGEIAEAQTKNNSNRYNNHETTNESEDSEFIEMLIDTFGDENGEEGILRMLEEQGFLNDGTRMIVGNLFRDKRNNEKNNKNSNIITEETTENIEENNIISDEGNNINNIVKPVVEEIKEESDSQNNTIYPIKEANIVSEEDIDETSEIIADKTVIKEEEDINEDIIPEDTTEKASVNSGDIIINGKDDNASANGEIESLSEKDDNQVSVPYFEESAGISLENNNEITAITTDKINSEEDKGVNEDISSREIVEEISEGNNDRISEITTDEMVVKEDEGIDKDTISEETTEVMVRDDNQKNTSLYDALKSIFTLIITAIRFVYHFIFNKR